MCAHDDSTATPAADTPSGVAACFPCLGTGTLSDADVCGKCKGSGLTSLVDVHEDLISDLEAIAAAMKTAQDESLAEPMFHASCRLADLVSTIADQASMALNQPDEPSQPYVIRLQSVRAVRERMPALMAALYAALDGDRRAVRGVEIIAERLAADATSAEEEALSYLPTMRLGRSSLDRE